VETEIWIEIVPWLCTVSLQMWLVSQEVIAWLAELVAVQFLFSLDF